MDRGNLNNQTLNQITYILQNAIEDLPSILNDRNKGTNVNEFLKTLIQDLIIYITNITCIPLTEHRQKNIRINALKAEIDFIKALYSKNIMKESSKFLQLRRDYDILKNELEKTKSDLYREQNKVAENATTPSTSSSSSKNDEASKNKIKMLRTRLDDQTKLVKQLQDQLVDKDSIVQENDDTNRKTRQVEIYALLKIINPDAREDDISTMLNQITEYLYNSMQYKKTIQSLNEQITILQRNCDIASSSTSSSDNDDAKKQLESLQKLYNEAQTQLEALNRQVQILTLDKANEDTIIQLENTTLRNEKFEALEESTRLSRKYNALKDTIREKIRSYPSQEYSTNLSIDLLELLANFDRNNDDADDIMYTSTPRSSSPLSQNVDNDPTQMPLPESPFDNDFDDDDEDMRPPETPPDNLNTLNNLNHFLTNIDTTRPPRRPTVRGNRNRYNDDDGDQTTVRIPVPKKRKVTFAEEQ